MRGCLSVLLALASSLVSGCAEGYPVTDSSESAALIPSTGGMGGGGGAGGAPGSGGMGGGGASGGMSGEMSGSGGMLEPAGEPCTQNDMRPCPCEGSDAMGQQICMFDPASPSQGSFSGDCRGCPAPEPMASCSDAMQNGDETGVDCGGPDCMPCAMATGGSSGAGGSGGTGGTGGMSETGGSGGEAASGGESGSGGEEPTGPVEDCDGVPEGTECDRDCILPSNTARCNDDGECSCLN